MRHVLALAIALGVGLSGISAVQAQTDSAQTTRAHHATVSHKAMAKHHTVAMRDGSNETAPRFESFYNGPRDAQAAYESATGDLGYCPADESNYMGSNGHGMWRDGAGTLRTCW